MGQAEAIQERLAELSEQLQARSDELVAAIERGSADVRALNGQSRWIDLAWTPEEGLRNREWFRSRFVAPDATSGYASWALPGVRYEAEFGDSLSLTESLSDMQAVLDRIDQMLSAN